MAKNWLDKYDNGGTINGPKVPPIKLAGTEVYEHGEDNATANHQENGINPTDLTAKGVKYAKRIGKQAAKQKKNTVISSDIERAVQTAGIMADEAGMQHYTSPLLRTWNIGEYDGAPEGSFKEKDWVKNPNTPVPGGEPFSNFAQRMEQAYNFVKKAPSTDDIITHSKVTRAFKALESTDGQWTDKTTKKFASLKDEPKTKAKDGMNLEKIHDNYGKHGNYNDASASTGPGFVGMSNNTVGRHYSPAWGGQFAMGGSLPGAVGFTYAREAGSAPANGKYTKKTKASAADGTEIKESDPPAKQMPKPYFNSAEEREAYRSRLKDVAKKALEPGSDEAFLLETPYHQIETGNNCINGVCGLNTAAGLKYSNPADKDRYLGNTKFSDAVKEGKEDYYQVAGNFQIGDHIQYLNDKGVPHHSKMIYDITKDDKGKPEYHVIHNFGGKTFAENIYSENEMKDMLSGKMPLTASAYSKINVYRPGYNLDKPLLDKEREAKTSPEARQALAERATQQNWDASHDPNYKYSIRPDSEYYKNQPEGMKKFVDFANDDAKVTELSKKLGVGKDIIHDQLLNTFGELGQENKWSDRWFGGTWGIENTIEKIVSPKSWSIGPGQIKYKTLDPELKEKFNIKKESDLHDIDKVIPLMTAINVRNKQWMERQGENLSTKLVGNPGTSAEDIKYGIDRWVPYAYQGLPSDPTAAVRKQAEANANEYRMSVKDREQYINDYINKNVNSDKLKTFNKGSYAQNVYDLIDKNLQRTMPAENYEQYNELMPATVKSKKKMVNGGEMRFYQEGLDWTPKTISKNGAWLNKYK